MNGIIEILQKYLYTNINISKVMITKKDL